MMGLSAQDSNIQAFFASAEATMRWPWPGDRPSFVFSGDQVGGDQEALLKNVYPQAYTAAARGEINDQSLIKAYANPLLVALLLSVICDKLRCMVDLAQGSLDPDGKSAVKQGIVSLRDHLACLDNGSRLEFVKQFADCVSRITTMFRDGTAGTAPRRYNPITSIPLHQIAADQNIPSFGLPEVAVVAGVLGMGVAGGTWKLENVDTSDPTAGAVRVSTTASSTKVVLAANGRAAVRLQQNGHIVDDEDAVLIYSAEKPLTMPRSPRSSPGRTGHLGLREVSIYDLLQTSANANDLMQLFREEAAI
jgi:hypothetical protein